MKKKTTSDEEIKEIVFSGKTMNECANILGIPFTTFKRRAIHLNIYKPNTGRKGLKRESKEYEKIKIPLEKIISGDYGKKYTSSRLRKRLIDEGYKKNICEGCGINEWMGEILSLELHHKDGNHLNNHLENLSILCPNCHSLTPNHSIKKYEK